MFCPSIAVLKCCKVLTMTYVSRFQPNGDRWLYKHDGADQSQKKSSKDVGGCRGHVRYLLLSRALDEFIEVRR